MIFEGEDSEDKRPGRRRRCEKSMVTQDRQVRQCSSGRRQSTAEDDRGSFGIKCRDRTHLLGRITSLVLWFQELHQDEEQMFILLCSHKGDDQSERRHFMNQ